MKGSFPVNYRLFQFVTVCFIFILSLALLTTSFILLSEELHKKVDQGLTAIMVVHVCEIYMTLSSFINCLVVKAQHLARISLTAGGITLSSLLVILIGEIFHAVNNKS